MLLAVAHGDGYRRAALSVGRRSGAAVSHLVARFNAGGCRGADQGQGGRPRRYDDEATERILREARRTPTPKADGTATWTLSTLRGNLAQRRRPVDLAYHRCAPLGGLLHQNGLVPMSAAILRVGKGDIGVVTVLPDA